MSVRTRDWLKFGALVAIAFIFGLAFASTRGLPKAGGLPESVAAAPAPTPSELGAQGSAPRTPVVVPKAVADLGDAFVSIAEHVKPAVVFIKSQHVERADNQRLPPGFEDFFPQFRRRPQVEQGSGSGFIVSSDGYILTNNHVVAGADKVTVRLYDKREFTAKVVGTDPNTDVAVIKIDARGLPGVAFGNSDSARVGEWVLAIGNPLGEAFAFTVTARIVIAINSAIASETGFYAGYGFAIPMSLARTVMDQLVKTGRVERAVMGVAIHDARQEDADAVGLKQISGVVVDSYTSDDSPARKDGIQPGDVIVAVDGQPVDNTPQLQQRVAFKKPGETVEVTVLRQGGEKKTVTVRLARAPGEADSEVASVSSKSKNDASSKEEMLGISVEPRTQDDARDVRLRSVLERGGGLVVADVSPDGPAFQRLQSSDDPGGPDIIIAVNGVPTRSRAAFREALKKVKAGDVVTLQVLSRSPDATDGWAGRIVRLRAR